MTTNGSKIKRRAILMAGAAAVGLWVWGLPRLIGQGRSDLEFHDIAGLEPFRSLSKPGSVTSSAAFVGIESSGASDPARTRRLRADLCGSLFRDWDGQGVPVALFSDFNCPNCRLLEKRMDDFEMSHPGVLWITRHELPLLGAASLTAAKAVLAAGEQGVSAAMSDRLSRTGSLVDLGFVTAIAPGLGLDVPRLLRDMEGQVVAERLADAQTLAQMFGYFGTPATIIGRNSFMGAISAVDLEILIEMAKAGPPPC